MWHHSQMNSPKNVSAAQKSHDESNRKNKTNKNPETCPSEGIWASFQTITVPKQMRDVNFTLIMTFVGKLSEIKPINMVNS